MNARRARINEGRRAGERKAAHAMLSRDRRCSVCSMKRATHRRRRAALGPLVALLVSGCAPGSAGQWQTIGPSSGATVLSMAVDPFNPRLLYAGSNGGGV